MPIRLLLALLVSLGSLGTACASEQPACVVRVVRQELTNGASRSEYLKLEPWQEDALVHIHVGGEPRCSGVLVAERSVLTAKHCMQHADESMEVGFGANAMAPAFQTPARVIAAHPELDIVALELEASPSDAFEVAPLPVARAWPAALERGSLVQLAGFGAGTDAAGERAFLVEEVARIDDQRIEVTANGLAGACFGDSGGPLLVRADGGHVHTLALLDSGTASCFGTDLYTRLDRLGDWFEREAPDVLEPDPASEEREHATLGRVGRCFDGEAVWFEGGRLRAARCDEGHVCGWSARAGGFRCIARGADPCRGIGDVGVCEGGIAVRCVRGRLERNPCATCGFSCARSPKTGGPVCLAANDPQDGG